MVSAENSKVPGASFASAFRHGTQPGGLVLLSDALWHRNQIFRIGPATVIVLGDQSRGLPIRDNGGGIERSCSTMLVSKMMELMGESTFRN